MPRVTIRLSETGFGEVLLDGQPIATQAIAVTSEAGEPTEVTLVLAPSEVEIDVHVEDRLLLLHQQRRACRHAEGPERVYREADPARTSDIVHERTTTPGKLLADVQVAAVVAAFAALPDAAFEFLCGMMALAVLFTLDLPQESSDAIAALGDSSRALLEARHSELVAKTDVPPTGGDGA